MHFSRSDRDIAMEMVDPAVARHIAAKKLETDACMAVVFPLVEAGLPCRQPTADEQECIELMLEDYNPDARRGLVYQPVEIPPCEDDLWSEVDHLIEEHKNGRGGR